MQQITVNKNEAGQRMDKLLLKLFINAKKNFLYKMLRKKNITLNGRKASGNEMLQMGDVIEVFFSEETFHSMIGDKDEKEGFSFAEKDSSPEKVGTSKCDSSPKKTGTPKCDSSLKKDGKAKDNSRTRNDSRAQNGILHQDLTNTKLPTIIYENEDVIIFNKPAGMLSQKAEQDDISMVELLQEYLLRKGEITKEQLRTFRPGVCNRLDRNTSGLILAGKSLCGLQQLSELLKNRTLDKYYLCVVKGELTEPMRLTGYLVKNEKNNCVTIGDGPEGERIITEYRPLKLTSEGTLLEVKLVTGKSHQIRAHLASIGHPIAGDVKYGNEPYNRRMRNRFGVHHQMLHAWRMKFPEQEKGIGGKEFRAAPPEEFLRFMKEYGIPEEELLCHHGIQED